MDLAGFCLVFEALINLFCELRVVSWELMVEIYIEHHKVVAFLNIFLGLELPWAFVSLAACKPSNYPFSAQIYPSRDSLQNRGESNQLTPIDEKICRR